MNNDYPRMLYKAMGAVGALLCEAMHGGHFATKIVNDEAEHEEAAADGWHIGTEEAKQALADAKAAADAAAKTAAEAGAGTGGPDQTDDSAPPTRAELEQKARELGIEFNHRHVDKTLAKMISDKLAADAAAKA